jgi:hypothetical protein
MESMFREQPPSSLPFEVHYTDAPLGAEISGLDLSQDIDAALRD